MITHVPGAEVTTVVPDTLHTCGTSDVKDTGRPEVADADKVTGTPTSASGGWANLISCQFLPALTGIERATSGAGAKYLLPPCEAVITHTPAAAVTTVDPDTVHTSGASDVKDTGRPEVADADKVTGTPTSASGGSTNVSISCPFLPAPTGNERATSGAGAKYLLPPCEAVITHVPGAAVTTVDPDTVHTSGASDVKDTGRPEVADADKVTGAPTSASGGWANVISCLF